MTVLFNFESTLYVIVLTICTATFVRSYYPSLFTRQSQELHKKCLYKCSVIGERCSPLIALVCVWMALRFIFF